VVLRGLLEVRSTGKKSEFWLSFAFGRQQEAFKKRYAPSEVDIVSPSFSLRRFGMKP
jgi:hypothetical protein